MSRCPERLHQPMMENTQEFWREHLLKRLQELRVGEHLLEQEWINSDILKYGVLWEGCRAIERKLTTYLHELGGLDQEW